LDFAALSALGSPSFRAVERERRDAVAVLYTGGTTGVPKGVLFTQEGLDFSCQSIALYERYAHADFSLCFLPFNHVFGQIYIMNATILTGGCLELMPLDMDGSGFWIMTVTRFYAFRPFTRLINIPI
jgi:long-chain acyl-CoA synthetase